MKTCKRCNKEKDENHDCKTHSCVWCDLDKCHTLMTRKERDEHYKECNRNKEELACKLLKDYTGLRKLAIQKEDAVEYLKDKLYNKKVSIDNMAINVYDNTAILEREIEDYFTKLVRIFIFASEIQCNMNLRKLITTRITINEDKKVSVEFINGEILEDDEVFEMLKEYSKK